MAKNAGGNCTATSYPIWCCIGGDGDSVDDPLMTQNNLLSLFFLSNDKNNNSRSSMGTTTSKTLTLEEQDLKWLGEHFPYGDAELRQLYQAYQRLLLKKQKEPSITTSFFQDWAVECWNSPTNVNASSVQAGRCWSLATRSQTLPEERRAIISMMEEQILGGTQVGNALFQVACCCGGDTTTTSWYGTKNEISNTTSKKQELVDEFTRKARLERLFEGFADMGRRGAKQALTVLFQVVQQLQNNNKNNNSDANTVNIADKHPCIPARPLMDLGYRLALAASFLQAVQAMDLQQEQNDEKRQQANGGDHDEDDYQDETDTIDIVTRASQLLQQKFLPAAEDHRDHRQHHQGLEPMAHSLTEKAKSRANRYGITTENQKEWDDTDPVVVELQDLLEWSESVAPLFATILPTLLFYIVFPGRAFPPSKTPFEFPNHKIDDDNSDNKKTTTSSPPSSDTEPSVLDSSTLAFALACCSPSLMGPYFRLYTSAADGLSFNRLLNALLGYSGPTLILIQSTTGGVFGAFTSHAWKESKDFYGNSDCFLFQLLDSLAVYRPTGREQNYMYCNSFARSKGYDQQAHGIGFGGTVNQPRLFIAENLMEECQAASQDVTFENGALLPKRGDGSSSSSKFFEIQSMEVWGVGGRDIVQQALDGRRKARELREEGIRRARKVDKAQFLDDFRSGAIESKAFAYKQQIDGRADQDVDNRHRNQYDYEK